MEQYNACFSTQSCSEVLIPIIVTDCQPVITSITEYHSGEGEAPVPGSCPSACSDKLSQLAPEGFDVFTCEAVAELEQYWVQEIGQLCQ